MSERTEKFDKELEALVNEGEQLLIAIQYECHPSQTLKQSSKLTGCDIKKLEAYFKNLPNFSHSYQTWYSKAQAVIKQVLPHRLADFVSYYEYPRIRKNIDFQNYMIRDYLQGLKITQGAGEKVVVDRSAAIPEFTQQLNIVKAAKVALGSTLIDLRAILQADLFDTEIETASALAKAGYLRAAGAICGVLIEKHLGHVCKTHNIKIAKKNPSISIFAQNLRSLNVITLANERFIQSLADTRNVCCHAKAREPTEAAIIELVEGTGKVLKTIF